MKLIVENREFKMNSIKNLFKISKGKKSIESNLTNLRYIQIEDLRGDSNIKFAIDSKENVICKKNDILIAWDGANAGTVGYGLEGVIGSTIAKLTPNSSDISTHYCGRFLQSKFKYLRESCTGATIPHISRSSLESLKIPLPPLEKQKKIAEILDKADEIRQKDKAIIAKYNELSQSLFLDMFGDPVSNPKGLAIVTIRDLVSDVKYGTSSKAEEDGKYPYLRMNNITYEGYMDYQNLKFINLKDNEKEKYLVKKGDILFNRTNSKELVGKTGIFNEKEEMAIAGYLIRVRVNENSNPYYLWAYLNSKHGKMILENMCKSIVGMANINAQELQDIKILNAPIELQNQFAERIELIEKQKQLAEKSLKKSEELFNSLLDKAFKGEL